MAVRSVQEAFIEFEREKVRVPAWQNEQAKKVHPRVRGAIEAALGEIFARAYLAGSYRRKVQTVRLNDVDIIVVLNDPEQAFAASARVALATLKQATAGCDLVTGSETSVRAVKLEIEGVEFTVDLVAALEDPSGEVLLARHIPEEGLDDWTAARPEGQTRAAAHKNEETEGLYVPAVRIVKYWNQRLGDGEKNLLPSYLIEAIMHHALAGPCEFDDACTVFFRLAADHLANALPSVTCPGDPENFVDERLEQQRRLQGLASVQEALEHVAETQAASSVGEALDAWAKVFGRAFPAPSTDASKLASTLRGEVALAGDRGIAQDGKGRPVIPARSWRR